MGEDIMKTYNSVEEMLRDQGDHDTANAVAEYAEKSKYISALTGIQIALNYKPVAVPPTTDDQLDQEEVLTWATDLCKEIIRRDEYKAYLVDLLKQVFLGRRLPDESNIYLHDEDQPMSCPKCGTRTEFFELENGTEVHICNNQECQFTFFAEHDE